MDTNTLTVGSLTILLININGLTQRKAELELFLHERRIDVALITETHTTTRTRFSIPNYTVVADT